MEVKRFALLLCSEDYEYLRNKHGGYLGVFVALLGDEGEDWNVFKVAKGELPDENEICKYEGFVISGSCSDAHGDDKWVRDFVAFLQKLDAMKKKVLGICFGHQVLCRAIGGNIGRSSKGWDIGVTCIHPTKATIKLLCSMRVPNHLPVIECHRDEVLELPPRAEVMAWSEKTGIEMFRCGDHLMGIQGHPEYTKDILLHLIDRLINFTLIQTGHAEVAKVSLDALEPDRESWKMLCKSFLKGKQLSS